MLQNIRDNAQGMVAKIVIGIIVISFALFGVQSLISGGKPYVATVNGEEILPSELNQAIVTERNRRTNMMGDNIDRALLEEKVLRKVALEQLIQQHLLLQVAREAKVDVSDSFVDQTIISTPQFQERGTFSSQVFQNILRSNGLTPSYYKQLLRTDLIIGQLSNGMTASDFVTAKELDNIAQIVGQKRSFKYLMLPKESVSAKVNISDTDIQQYFDDNATQFQTEDQVKLEYIDIKQEDYFKPVAEEAVRAAYEQELADLALPEQRRAAHILIEIKGGRDKDQALALAKDIKAKIDGGEDFGSLAKKFSDDKGSSDTDGDLGFTTGDSFPKEFEKALFALSPGATSAPVLTDAGYHLIRATEISAAEVPSFEDRRPVIEQRMKLDAAEPEFVAAVEELRDLVFNSEGLKGPAKELGLTVASSGWISRKSAKGLFADSRVLDAAFSDEVLMEGNNSEVIELAEDHFIVVNTIEHDPPHRRQLAEVKDAIKALLTRKEITTLSQQLAAETVNSIKSGGDLEQIAKELDAKWEQKTAVARTAMTVTRELMAAVFALPIPQQQSQTEAVTLSSGDVAVVILEQVEPGKLSDFSDTERLAIKAELQRGLRAAGTSNLITSLRATAEIDIL